MIELPFLRVLYWVAALHQVPCFHNPLAKTIIWGPFHSFKSKRLIRINPMHENTDNMSHVLILTGPDVTSSLTSYGSVNETTFSLHSFPVLSFDTKVSHLSRGWRILWANLCNGNLPFVSINVQGDSTTENIFMNISSCQFYRQYYYIGCIITVRGELRIRMRQIDPRAVLTL